MSLYKHEFSICATKRDEYYNFRKNDNVFSVILESKQKNKVHSLSPQSLAYAVKPVIYFCSIFGLTMFKYSNNSLKSGNLCSKLYSVFLITVKLLLLVYMRPGSWLDTTKDLPLHILTISFSILHEIEIFHCVIITSFFNSPYYVQLFKTLDKIDKHFSVSKKHYVFARSVSVILCLILPSIYFISTFFLRKFKIINIGIHLSFYIDTVQGSIIVLFALMLFCKLSMLNYLLLEKVEITYEELGEENMFLKLYQKFFSVRHLFDTKANKLYCWYELMKIYDLISDCFYLFNKIHAVQVLFMFLTWLVCTLLIICRSLSPSLKYKEIILSDLFIYTCLNIRPFLLAVICEYIVREKNKTLHILLQHLVHENNNLDQGYYTQIQTMIDLVETKKVEISTNIFSVNVPTVMNFAGRAISYTVLMIQYFYMHSA